MFLYTSFCGPMSSFLLGECLEVELLGRRADMRSVHLTYCEKSVQTSTLLFPGLVMFYLLHCSSLYRRRQRHPTSVLLPGKSHEWRSPLAAVHGVAEGQTQLSDFTFTFPLQVSNFNSLSRLYIFYEKTIT